MSEGRYSNKSHLVKTLSDTDAAYIAGIVDGEGCIFASIVWSRPQQEDWWSVYATLNVANTDRALIDYLVDTCGVGSVQEKKNQPNGTKPCWSWRVSIQSADALLSQLLPYLRCKKEQAELLVELAAHKRQSKSRVKHNPDRQLEIVEQLRGLNNDGKSGPVRHRHKRPVGSRGDNCDTRSC